MTPLFSTGITLEGTQNMTNRYTLLVLMVSVAILTVFTGCVPPPHLPPAPSEAISQNLVRVMPVPREAIFPKVLDVFVDLGYQVRCVNQDLGQVNIHRAWTEYNFQGNPFQYSFEATLLFKQETPQSTRVRIIVDYQSVFDGRQILDPTQCQILLQTIENALRPTR